MEQIAKRESNFEFNDRVIVSGSVSGYGDQEAYIRDFDYSKIEKKWYYTVLFVNPEIGQDWQIRVQERFLKKRGI